MIWIRRKSNFYLHFLGNRLFSKVEKCFEQCQVQKWGSSVWGCVLGHLAVFLTLRCLLEFQILPRYKLICSQSKNPSFPLVFCHFLSKKGTTYSSFSQVFSNKVVFNVARLSRRHLDATMKGSWRELKRGRRELKVSYLPGFYDAYSCRVLSTVFDSKKSNESQMVAWIMAVFTICGYFLGVQA